MTAPHDRPSAAELVAAVREFIERDVSAATEGRVRFHARVAANVLAMVEREIAAGGEQARAHVERLARLGVASDAELAAAIRAGEFDARADDLLAELADAVADKLSVANPRYAEDR